MILHFPIELPKLRHDLLVRLIPALASIQRNLIITMKKDQQLLFLAHALTPHSFRNRFLNWLSILALLLIFPFCGLMSQVVIYDIPQSDFLGGAANSCGVGDYGPGGSDYSITWQSTGGNIPSAVTVRFNCTANVAPGNVAVSLNGGGAVILQNQASLACTGPAIHIDFASLPTANYLPGGNNTITIVNSASAFFVCHPNPSWTNPPAGPSRGLAQVEVDYTSNCTGGNFTQHPSPVSACPNSTVTFQSAATGTTDSLRWQFSNNGGGSWMDIPETPPFSGTTTHTLTITNAPIQLHNAVFRNVLHACGGAADSSNMAPLALEDTQVPTVSCPPGQSRNVNGSCNYTVENYASLLTIADNCDPSPTVVQNPAQGTVINGGGNTINVTIQVTDSVGNFGGCSFIVTTVDPVAPSITCPSNQTVTGNANCQATLADYTPITATSDNCTASPSLVQSPVQGTTINGNSSVTITAQDAAGLSSSCSFMVIIADGTAPVVNCPGNLTVASNASCQYALPNLTGGATLSDNCDPNPSVTQSPSSGSMLNLGSNTITLTASDVTGNTSSCSFGVTVNDSTNPVLTCPGNSLVQAGGNCTYTLPNLTGMASVSDNCTASPTVTQSPVQNTAINLGPQTISITGTDASGNNATCTFTVTVEDTTSPTLSCPANQTVLAATGCTYSLPSYQDSVTVSDACDPNPGILQSPAMGTVLSGQGTTQTINISATDQAGNASSCSFVITVGGCGSDATLTGSTTICAGDTGYLQVNLVGGQAPYTIEIDNGVGIITNYTSGDPIPVTPISTTPYSLISATDANAVAANSLNGSALIKVNPNPAFTTQVTGASCAGNDGSIVLTVNSGNGPYTFSTNGGLTSSTLQNSPFTASGLNTGPYGLIVQDSIGCSSAIVVETVPLTNPPCPTAVTDLTFQQVNFQDTSLVIQHENSSWGYVEFQPYLNGSEYGYFSIAAQAGNGPIVWIVQNFPIFPDTIRTWNPRQGVDFDINLLGLSSGTNLPAINFSWFLTDTAVATPPGLLEHYVLVGDLARLSFGANLATTYHPITPGNPYGCIFPLPIFTDVILHDSTAEVQEGRSRCLAGAFARSIDWLNRNDTLGNTQTAQDIYDDLVDAEVGSSGPGASTYEEDIAAKDSILKKVDARGKTKVLDLCDAVGPIPGGDVPEETGTDLLKFICDNLKGKDIELHYDGHIITVTGKFKVGNKTFLKYRDDEKQGDDTKGDKAEKTGELKKNPTTGKYEFAGEGGAGFFDVKAAIVEWIDKTVGMPEVEPQWVEAQLFPNPNSGTFNLTLTAPQSGPVQLSLYNAMGNVVNREVVRLQSGKNQLERAYPHLSAGMYLIRIETLDGQLSTTLRMLKQ